jgi:hypothetical protein
MEYRIVRPTAIEFDTGQPKLFVLTSNEISRNLDKRMSRVQMGARFRVRVRTGKLISTIRKNPGVTAGAQHVDLLAGGRGANYVMIEHDGSRPHLIRARRRKALRIPVPGGGVVFRRQVRHPGTTGTFFLTRSLPLAAAD